MNIANFQILLQEAIDNATSTIDYLFLSKALQSLNVGQIRSVANFASLPSAGSNEGLLVWVVADERLYWSTGTAWYQITSSSVNTLYGWGRNSGGELGDNTTVSKSSPVSVIGNSIDWCAVSSGINSSLAIKKDGSLWAWGCNTRGKLGNNNTNDTSSPVSVVGGFTDWCQVSAGPQTTTAVRQNGTLWAWGWNYAGGLGDGTTTDRSSPVSVVGGFTDWRTTSTLSFGAVAVRANGSLWAWGLNSSGQLGDGTTVSRTSPVSVIGGFTNWCQVSVGYDHAVAVRTNGTAWAWGFNNYGRLGDGTATFKSSPVSVIGGFTDWSQISAGGFHTIGLRSNPNFT